MGVKVKVKIETHLKDPQDAAAALG